MIDWWKALILGLVQGVTEFLPVSSSGHLLLTRELLGLEEIGLAFDIFLHVGTVIAVCAVLWRQIINVFKHPKQLVFVIIASIPAAVAGFLLNDYVESVFVSARWLWVLFLITAILLLVTDILGKKIAQDKITKLGYGNVAVMGLWQAAAIVPGLSRSGTTICAGVLSGAKRDEVANFSFIMSIPVILGAAAYQALKILKGEVAVSLASPDIISIVLGVIVSSVSGFFVIKFMLKLIRQCNLKWFSLYLGVLALLLFVNFVILPKPLF